MAATLTLSRTSMPYYLVSDYSLDEHKERVGEVPGDSINYVLESRRGEITYVAKLDTELLPTVRRDPGVHLVEHLLTRRLQG